MNKTAIKVSIVISATVIAFGLGRFTAPGGSAVLATVVDSSGFSLIDSLIAVWADERTVGMGGSAALTASMVDNSGVFAVGTFPDTVKRLAVRIETMYGVPAPVTLAQFALESRFGTRHMNANNFFGHTAPVAIKYAPPPPLFVSLPTREFIRGKWTVMYRRFAKYKSIEESFGAHGQLMLNVYAYAGVYKSAPALYAKAVGKKYATDPDYALKLITVMKRYKLIDGV